MLSSHRGMFYFWSKHHTKWYYKLIKPLLWLMLAGLLLVRIAVYYIKHITFMSILKRIYKKLMLWINFAQISSNYWHVVWFRIVNMLSLDKSFPYEAKIKLNNGIVLDYGEIMDLSAVPVAVEIWHEKIYHPRGYEIGENDVVVDIGANIGNFVMSAAKATRSTVYAFEPVPKNFELLKRNIALNNLFNVVPLQQAVAGESGTVVMHVSAVDTAHSITHKAFAQAGDVEVEAVTLEQFCDQHNVRTIDFLKVDSEGAEYDMFAQMSAGMLARIGKIAIEHHERFVGRDHAEISNKLRAHGFEVLELPDHFIFASKK